MRLATIALAVGLAGCGPYSVGENLAMKTTPKLLKRGQASLQMESDYEMARQAIPGALKTVESFWINAPNDEDLTSILAEGYCQYGTAFVEDDWEAAKLEKNLAMVEYTNTRASKMYTRCLNYSLMLLGKKWKTEIFGLPDQVAALVKGTGKDKRFAMLFAGLALGSLINHNQTKADGTINADMIGYLDTVQKIFARVLEIDGQAKGCPPAPQLCQPKTVHVLLPYVALGMLDTARSKALGGDPEHGKVMFQKALDMSNGRFLLARALMGIRYGIAMNDRKFFHEQLKIVLETDPAIWPEQRLANEVAHRKARRYLSKEKELFQ
jgi:hypothetical protein